MTDGITANAAPIPSEGGTPGQTTTTPSLMETDKYRGKSVEDVAKMHAELERRFGEQGNEVGATRAQLSEMQQQIEFLATQALQTEQERQRGMQQAQPARTTEPVVSDTEWINNPTEAATKLASRVYDEKIGQLTQLFQQQQARSDQDRYLNGMERAMTERPDLFKGVEKEVQQGIQMAYRSGKLNSESLRDPETWFAAAILMHAKKTGYKFPAQAGMTAPQGEMPSGNRIPGGQTQSDNRIVTVDKDLDVDSFENYLVKKKRFTDEDVAWTRKSPGTAR